MSTDEEKISRLYQQGNNKNNNETPSAQLDSTILKIAHQAVKKPSAVKGPFSGGWPAATAIAAVLIISVILVPLIQQEIPPATSTNIADETQELMLEQDDIGRLKSVKAKKDTLEKKQKRRIKQAPQERPQKELRRDQSFAEEETHTQKATSDLPSVQQTKPASAAAGKSILNANELKSEIRSKPQQLNTYGQTADSVSPATLTPKMWLKKIKQLIDQDKLDLAQEELDSFKIHYPDEEIEQSILNSFKSHSGLN